MTEDERKQAVRDAINSAASFLHDATRWDQCDEADEDGQTPMDRLVDRLERVYDLQRSDMVGSEVDNPLTVFCDPDNGRYSLEKPFVWDGFEYATDGRIAVRRPTNEPDTDLTQRRVPSRDAVSSVFDPIPTDLTFEPIPPRDLDGECDCDLGTIRCECCEHETPCSGCYGSGRLYSWIKYYAVKLLADKQIRSLPNVEVAMFLERESIVFRSGDVLGITIALRDEDDQKKVMKRQHQGSN